MTEHTKIPAPSENETSGRTLIERAGESLDFAGFRPAPVPRELAAVPRRWAKVAPKLAIEAKKPSPLAGEGGAPSGAEGEGAAAIAAAYAADPSPNPLPQGERAFGAADPSPNPLSQGERAFGAADPSSNPLPQGERAIRADPTFETVPQEPRVPARRVAFPSERHAIDRARLQQQGLILPEGNVTTLLEEFRIVKRQILLAARDGQSGRGAANAQRVLVCSPLPGEGKTFCATNLALAIAAEKDTEVVLVDADFAKPSIMAVLGLSGGPGLMDALADPAIAVEDCVLATDVPGLFVLPAGNQTATDSEFLSSTRTAEVLARLTQGAPNRIVIFDSPPALAASPAAELAKHVGQALVVVRADQTGQSALEDTISLLSSCPDIKLLLNAAFFSPSGRRFGNYYGYGG